MHAKVRFFHGFEGGPLAVPVNGADVGVCLYVLKAEIFPIQVDRGWTNFGLDHCRGAGTAFGDPVDMAGEVERFPERARW